MYSDYFTFLLNFIEILGVILIVMFIARLFIGGGNDG